MDIKKIIKYMKECYGSYASLTIYADGSGHISIDSSDGEIDVLSFEDINTLHVYNSTKDYHQLQESELKHLVW